VGARSNLSLHLLGDREAHGQEKARRCFGEKRVSLSLPRMLTAFWSGAPGKWFRPSRLLSCCSDEPCQGLRAHQAPGAALPATKLLETVRAPGFGKGESVKPATRRSFEDWKSEEGYKTIKRPWCEGSRV